METFNQSIIQGLVQIAVTSLIVLAGMWGVLKRQFKNGGSNGCSIGNDQFIEHQQNCNKKFEVIAEERGKVSESLKNIEDDIGLIKRRIYRRLK